jgi:hypothetical protein
MPRNRKTKPSNPATSSRVTNPVLEYLPPGWTEQKLRTATDTDYQSLTEEQLQKIIDRGDFAAEHHAQNLKLFEQINAKRIARGAKLVPNPHNDCNDVAGTQGKTPLPSRQVIDPARKTPNDYNAVAGREGKRPQPSQQVIDPATENLTALIDLVEHSDWDVFGFMLFRTHYSCEEQWEAFKEGFCELLDESIAAASAELETFDRIQEKGFIPMNSYHSLQDATPFIVRGTYLICFKEEEATNSDDEDRWGGVVEPGLTTNMCLMADEECMRSVLDKSATPFVKAVDVTSDSDLTIKVAITSLVPAFYAALLVYSPHDVASKVSDDGIWRNIGPWDADLEGRRVMGRLSLQSPALRGRL